MELALGSFSVVLEILVKRGVVGISPHTLGRSEKINFEGGGIAEIEAKYPSGFLKILLNLTFD